MRSLAWLVAAGSVVGASACAQAECESLTDCPGALVCSAEGSCVENENPAARALPSASGDTRFGVGGRTIDAPPLDLPGYALSGTSRMEGRVGALDVNSAAELTGSSLQVMATTPEGALVFVFGNAEGVLMEALTTPGTRVFAGDTFDAPVYGVTCAPTYDEAATGGVEVVVSEPDDDGAVTVEITERNAVSDVTVTTGFAPI